MHGIRGGAFATWRREGVLERGQVGCVPFARCLAHKGAAQLFARHGSVLGRGQLDRWMAYLLWYYGACRTTERAWAALCAAWPPPSDFAVMHDPPLLSLHLCRPERAWTALCAGRLAGWQRRSLMPAC